jgi:hypothetical protein
VYFKLCLPEAGQLALFDHTSSDVLGLLAGGDWNLVTFKMTIFLDLMV